MKLAVGIILSAFVLQALALPTFEANPHASEHMPINEDSSIEHIPKNEIVEQFRYDIFYWFTRFANFYNVANALTRDYRFDHIYLVTRVYRDLITVLGDDIETVRMSAYDVIALTRERSEELGEDNECILGAVDDFDANSAFIGAHIQSCSIYANTTMSALLESTFYPVFVEIKNIIAMVPLITVDVLARGNVLQDEREIIEYLAGQYQILELQWLGAVSQLLRWESNRYEVDGLFLVDETTICMAQAVLEYVITNAGIEQTLNGC